jgi:hypothetical protein
LVPLISLSPTLRRWPSKPGAARSRTLAPEASNTRRYDPRGRTTTLRGQDQDEAVAVLDPARQAPRLDAVAIRHLTGHLPARAPPGRRPGRVLAGIASPPAWSGWPNTARSRHPRSYPSPAPCPCTIKIKIKTAASLQRPVVWLPCTRLARSHRVVQAPMRCDCEVTAKAFHSEGDAFQIC